MRKIPGIAAALVLSATLMHPFRRRKGASLASHPVSAQPTQAGHRGFGPQITHFAVIAIIMAALGVAAVCWTNKSTDSRSRVTAAKTRSESIVRAPVAAAAKSVATNQVSAITPGELPYDGEAPTPQGKIAMADGSALERNYTPVEKLVPKGKTPANALPAKVARVQGDHRSEKSRDSHIVRGSYPKNRHSGKPHSMRGKKAEPLLASVARSKRVQLAQCAKTANLFKRERCRWNVCNGMWGKHGCPSYKNQVALP